MRTVRTVKVNAKCFKCGRNAKKIIYWRTDNTYTSYCVMCRELLGPVYLPEYIPKQQVEKYITLMLERKKYEC